MEVKYATYRREIPGRNNYSLYRQTWLPDGIPIAVLVVVHGVAEHSGRYSNLVNYFVPKGYAIYSFDLRGHGKSEGKRGYVERFSYYLDDLKTFYDKVSEENKNMKIFLVGHSMGGTIAIAYAIEHQSELNGLIVSGTTFKSRCQHHQSGNIYGESTVRSHAQNGGDSFWMPPLSAVIRR